MRQVAEERELEVLVKASLRGLLAAPWAESVLTHRTGERAGACGAPARSPDLQHAHVTVT